MRFWGPRSRAHPPPAKLPQSANPSPFGPGQHLTNSLDRSCHIEQARSGGVATAGEDPPPPLRAWAGLKPLDQKCQRPRGAHGAFQISGELGIAQCRRLPRFPVVLKASFEDHNYYRLFGRVYQVLHVENVEKASLDRLEVFGCYGVLNPSPYPVDSCAADFVEAMECHRDHEIALRP